MSNTKEEKLSLNKLSFYAQVPEVEAEAGKEERLFSLAYPTKRKTLFIGPRSKFRVYINKEASHPAITGRYTLFWGRDRGQINWVTESRGYIEKEVFVYNADYHPFGDPDCVG